MTRSIETTIAAKLITLRATLSTAESCSGGLISHRITNTPGSSQYFLGGVVAYSNEAKQQLLHVPEDLLLAHGAVSEPIARAMAEGACRVFESDYAVAVTGIAGPSGGTAEKPVGLVYIAIAGPTGTIVERHQFDGARETVKEKTAESALNLLLEQLH